MSYQVRRVDPYWVKNPILPVAAVAGVMLAFAGVQTGKVVVAIAGVVVAGIAIFLATKPAVSAVLGTLGLLGGIVTFLLVPNSNNLGMAASMRALSTLLFTVFYMVLMDGVVLMVCVLYNLFAGVLGMGGLSLDLEEEGGAS